MEKGSNSGEKGGHGRSGGAKDGGAGRNRRSHERVAAKLPIEASHGGHRVEIEAANICEGGAYCRCDAPIGLMTVLQVSLDLQMNGYGDGEGPIVTDAIVVRCEPNLANRGLYNLALFFPHLDQDSRDRIARFVQRRRATEEELLRTANLPDE